MRQGEVHALMGPNGSGKSTLVNALMGNPSYHVTGGTATLNGEEHHRRCLPTSAPRWASSWVSSIPPSIPGVSVANFMRTALMSLITSLRPAAKPNCLTRQGRVQARSLPPSLSWLPPTYVGRGGVAARNPAIKEFRKNLREKLALLKMDE